MSKRINIGFLMSRLSERGGISRVTSILTGGLEKTDKYNIHIFSFHPRNTSGYEWSDNLIYHDLFTSRPSMKKGIFKGTIYLRKIITDNRISILISCGHLVGTLGALSTILKKTKLVYWSHSSFIGEKQSFKLFSELFTSVFASHIVTLTKSGIKDYQKKTFAKRVVQIYNPIDNKLLSLKAEYNSETKKILSVGRITESKNFHTKLLKVAIKVLTLNTEYTWHIYGSGELNKELINQIKINNLEDRVIFEGHSDNIYEIYSHHSILVMTSSYEGLPMSLLEGMANNLPLVSFNVPTGPNEIIHNGKNGFLIEPFNIEDMSSRINELILSQDKRNEFSNFNKSLIKEFKESSVVEKWNTLLLDLK